MNIEVKKIKFQSLINPVKKIRVSTKRKQIYLINFIVTVTLGLILFYFENNLNNNFNLILKLIFYYLVISTITSAVKILIISIYRKRNKISSYSVDNMILGLNKLFIILNIIIYSFVILSFSGLNTIQFFTTLGLFSVATAWLFKEKFSNMLEGLTILFSPYIKIRDYIQVNNYTGVVQNIDLINTQILTDEGDIVYIPNSILMNTEVINFSKSEVKKVTYDFRLSRENFKKIKSLEKYLTSKAEEFYSEIVDFKETNLRINNITDEFAELTFEIEVTKYNLKIYNEIKKFISRNIVEFLTKVDTKKI